MAFFNARPNAIALLLVLNLSASYAIAKEAIAPFRIEVIDAENGWFVPLVELKTVHGVKFHTDNAGVVAFDLPELMGRETWLDVASDGYEVPADGFGRRGVRVTPKPGAKHTIKVNRTIVAKRLGRITGAGIFGESQKLGTHRDWKESGVLGQDSVQSTVHRGRLFWAWGDTSIARYPLGIFHMTGATTPQKPVKDWKPPLKLKLDYFRDDKGELRGIAKMPGDGPTWLSGFVSLPDKNGKRKLVASYVKIKGTLTAYEAGLCTWNDTTNNFEQLLTYWTSSNDSEKTPPMPTGHAVVVDGNDGRAKVLFGDPFPALRCDATLEAWSDPRKWELLTPQAKLQSADGAMITPHAGSIAWNKFRRRWVTAFHEFGGKPSFLGEVWYAEADSPTGPWGPAVKVLSHEKHSFYNVRLHPVLVPEDSSTLLFEGTYTSTFSANAIPTPRFEYNQIMYRLDLDDPKLAPAQSK